MSAVTDKYLSDRQQEDADGDALVAENQAQAEQIVSLNGQVDTLSTAVADRDATIVQLQNGSSAIHDQFVTVEAQITQLKLLLDQLLGIQTPAPVPPTP